MKVNHAEKKNVHFSNVMVKNYNLQNAKLYPVLGFTWIPVDYLRNYATHIKIRLIVHCH